MKKSNFSDVYNEVCAKHGQRLEKMRKEVLVKDLIIIIATIVLLIAGFKKLSQTSADFVTIYFMLVIIIVILIMLLLVKISKKYVEDYKKNVITALVEECNPNYYYTPKKGVTSADYNASGFDRTWDHFYSEDYICGKLENVSLKMSQVKTTEEHETTDSDGHRQTTTVVTFLGLYGIIMLPFETKMDIRILSNSRLRKFNKKRVEMESSEFEKHFDVLAEDRQGAMEVLTQESIEKITGLRNLYKKPINIRVNGRFIYFRVECGDLFEPPTFKSTMNFDMLYKYFNIIDAPRAMYEAVIDNIMISTGNHDELRKRQILNMSSEEKAQYEATKKKEEESGWFTTNNE